MPSRESFSRRSARFLLPAAWAHGRDECGVWRPPRQQVEEATPALAA